MATAFNTAELISLTLPSTTATTGVHATGTKIASVVMPYAGVITGVSVAVGTAPTGATFIVDVNIAGTTIYTTQANRPTIAIAGFSAVGGTAAANTFTAGQVVTVDIDQIGSSEAGRNGSVHLLVDFAPTAALVNA